MLIRKGTAADLLPLEKCDFSFNVNHIARGPFIDSELRIESLSEPFIKTYELDLQTLEDHCVKPDALFLLAETGERDIAGFITASLHNSHIVSIDYLATDSALRRHGAARKLMSAVHRWAEAKKAAGLRLETQNVNVPACLFYRQYGFELAGYDRYLYDALPQPEKDEVALFWYYRMNN